MSNPLPYKMNLKFSADEALMYLLQQTTKQPSEEILGFFYDLGIKVAEIGIDNISGRGIRKDIRDCYPGTAVPFKLLVKGHYYHYRNDEERTFGGSIELSFPDTLRFVDQKALLEKIIEKTLLDGESLPDFPQPQSKTPKMYKDLIKEVLKKEK